MTPIFSGSFGNYHDFCVSSLGLLQQTILRGHYSRSGRNARTESFRKVWGQKPPSQTVHVKWLIGGHRGGDPYFSNSFRIE